MRFLYGTPAEGGNTTFHQDFIPEKIEGSSKSIKNAKGRIETTLALPLECIEISSTLKVARFPLGPEKSHIDELIRLGVLDENNIFDTKERNMNAVINSEIPQVFGYTIRDDQELDEIITDEKELQSAKRKLESTGKYPTLYTMNLRALEEWAKYFNGRLPNDYEELWEIYNGLSGEGMREKARHASIPFIGFSYKNNWSSVGRWACLISSVKVPSGSFRGICMDNGRNSATDFCGSSDRGFISFVVL